MMHFQTTRRQWIALSWVGLGMSLVLGLSTKAIAADQIVLRYGALERSIAVSDLSTFAETGEQSSDLQTYLHLARQNPEDVQQTLNQSTEINVRLLDRILNSPVGGLALNQLTRTVHTSSREGDKAALRSALVLSASDDNRVSLIEVIRNYPTQQVYVNGDRLVAAYSEISVLSRSLGSILQDIGAF